MLCSKLMIDFIDNLSPRMLLPLAMRCPSQCTGTFGFEVRGTMTIKIARRMACLVVSSTQPKLARRGETKHAILSQDVATYLVIPPSDAGVVQSNAQVPVKTAEKHTR
jgi:hypothetical protein